MKMRRLLLGLLILLMGSLLFAAPTMNVIWEWRDTDPDVEYFRFQVDGDSQDRWITVPADVTSYESTGLDPYRDHYLFLQSSYDGVHWSRTSVSVAAAALTKTDEEKIDESLKNPELLEVVPPSGNQVNLLSGDSRIKAPTSDTASTPEGKTYSEYGYKTNLLLGLGVGNFIPANNASEAGFGIFGIPYPRADIGVDFQNIVHAGPWGMGLRLDLNTVMMPGPGKSYKGPEDPGTPGEWDNFEWNDIWWDTSIDLKLMMYLGNDVFDFYFGGGFGYSILNPAVADEATELNWGHSLGNWGIFSSAIFVPANIGFRGRITKLFNLGLDIDFRYFIQKQLSMTLATSVVMGFTF